MARLGYGFGIHPTTGFGAGDEIASTYWDPRRRQVITPNTDPDPATRGGNGWSFFGTGQAQGGLGTTSGSTGYDPSNPFTTLRNPKNPGIDAALQHLLGQAGSLSTDPNAQKDTTISSTKSDALKSRLDSEYQNFDTDRAGNRSTLADFTASYLGADPQAKAQTDQEISSVGDFYNGKVQSDLDKIASDRALATRGAANSAANRAQRASNLGSLMRGGNDSYLQSQLADRTGDIYTKAAIDNAEQRKGDYLYSREGQNKLLGARGNLLDSYLRRSLVPMQVGQQANAADLQRLYGIGGAEAANTFTRVTNPRNELAQQIGLVGDLSRVDLGNTFYGLRKPYEPNVQGYVSDTSSGGGFNYGPAADAILAGANQGYTQPSIRATNPGQPSGFLPQAFDMGAGSTASQSRMPGSTVQGANGTFIVGPNGELLPVGPDGLTDQQRYFETAGGALPPQPQNLGTPMTGGRYFNATQPTWQGYDSLPNLDFMGA